MKRLVLVALPLLVACGAAERATSRTAVTEYTGRQRNTLNPTPVPLDSTWRERVQRYRTSDDAARVRLRNSRNDVELEAFAKRAAVFGMRERDVRWVEDGLTALAMISKSNEGPGDISIVQAEAMLYHSAKRSGADPAKLFGDAAAIAQPGIADDLDRFLEDEEMTTPAARGLEEVPTGFIERGRWDYAPTRDLRSAIIEIAGIIDRDPYEVQTVMIADKFPADLPGIRGVATVHTSWQKSLTVYLVEMPDAATAKELADRSRPGARVAVARGNLFVLIEADDEPGETPKSLERFVAPIARVLDKTL